MFKFIYLCLCLCVYIKCVCVFMEFRRVFIGVGVIWGCELFNMDIGD